MPAKERLDSRCPSANPGCHFRTRVCCLTPDGRQQGSIRSHRARSPRSLSRLRHTTHSGTRPEASVVFTTDRRLPPSLTESIRKPTSKSRRTPVEHRTISLQLIQLTVAGSVNALPMGMFCQMRLSTQNPVPDPVSMVIPERGQIL